MENEKEKVYRLTMMQKMELFIKKSWWPIILITIAAFFIRLYMAKYRFIPEGDGCHYVAFAKDFMHGNFSTIGLYWDKALVIFISLFGFIFKDVEFAGRLINVISGALLVWVSFIFAEKIFTRKIAYYSALLIAINLKLILFSTLLFTESLYTLSIMLIALSGWLSLERKRLSYFFLLGASIGFSYIVRNEALIFAPIFILLIIMVDYKKALANILFLIFGAMIFVFPMLLFNHWQYHIWTLGNKGIVNLLYGDNAAFSYKKLHEYTQDFSEVKYYNIVYNRFNDNKLAYLFENIFFIDRLPVNLGKLLHYLPNQFFSIPLAGKYISILFFLYASYVCLKNKILRIKYFYLLLFPSIAYFIVSLCFMEERKVIPFIPFFIFIICIGVYHLEQAIKSKRIRIAYYSLLTIIFAASSLIAFEKAKINDMETTKILIKETGLWMRHNLPQKEKVVVSESLVPYYFYEDTPNNFAIMIYADYQTIIKYMRFHKAKYLVVFSWCAGENPCVEFLFKNREPPDFELLRSIRRDTVEALIYQLK